MKKNHLPRYALLAALAFTSCEALPPEPPHHASRQIHRRAGTTPSAQHRRNPRPHAASPYPTAKRGKGGYAISPYTGANINVRGIPPGAKVLDPSAHRVFINP